MKSDVDITPQERAPFLIYLCVTAVLCGAFVMILEVLGSRVVGPFFGVSLFVWTSLITVTLVALAAGYAVGGIVSDARKSPDYLYLIIIISGLLVLLIPLVKAPVLKYCQSLGLRMGSFVSATILFGPSLFLLGCVSPYIIKIVVRETRNIGRTVGLFYALSTVGSFAGTVATGFVLIAYFRVNTIFIVVGLLLVGLSAGYFVVIRRKALPAALALVFGLAVVWSHPAPVTSKTMPNGTTVTEVYSKDSFYGSLKVVDYAYGPVHTREMIIDGMVQGGIDVRNGLPIYAFSYALSMMPLRVNPGGTTCLVIGLGPGTVLSSFESRGIRTDVVDINPDVVAAARDYFGSRSTGEVYTEDARYFLTTSVKKYDYIILDVFTADTTPAHLLTLEALRLVKDRMSEVSVVGVNLIGSLKRDTFMTASIMATLKEVFATVEAYPVFAPDEGEGIGNIIVVAYDYPFPPASMDTIRDMPVHPMAKAQVAAFPGNAYRFPPGTPAVILTDDYNPVDFYDVWVKERIRWSILDSTDPDILM